MLDFENFGREFKRERRFVLAVFIINAILGIGILGLLAWVAVHFLKKIW